MKLSCSPLTFTSNEAFSRNKRSLELVTLSYFPHTKYLKYLFCYVLLICEILNTMCIGIVCKPGCDVMNFEVSLIFLVKLLFLHGQNVTKT